MTHLRNSVISLKQAPCYKTTLEKFQKVEHGESRMSYCVWEQFHNCAQNIFSTSDSERVTWQLIHHLFLLSASDNIQVNEGEGFPIFHLSLHSLNVR